MKLTKSQLNQIIKEEFAKAVLVSEEGEELNEIDFLGKDSQRALEDMKTVYITHLRSKIC